MINKKFSMIVMVTVIAIASTGYAIYELSPPEIITIVGQSQFVERTFAEKVEHAGIIVQGEIKDSKIILITKESTETDIEGNEVVFNTKEVPHTEITIQISEVFKDNYGLDSDLITVYDRHPNGEIRLINGHKAKFISMYGIEYEKGDKGLFLIENDSRLWLHGFTSFYPIQDGKDTIKTAYDKKFHKPSIDITKAKHTAKLKGKK